MNELDFTEVNQGSFLNNEISINNANHPATNNPEITGRNTELFIS